MGALLGISFSIQVHVLSGYLSQLHGMTFTLVEKRRLPIFCTLTRPFLPNVDELQEIVTINVCGHMSGLTKAGIPMDAQSHVISIPYRMNETGVGDILLPFFCSLPC